MEVASRAEEIMDLSTTVLPMLIADGHLIAVHSDNNGAMVVQRERD